MIKEIIGNVWLMKDHKWAFYAWQKYKWQKRIPFLKLLHCDFHWDGINDFQDQEEINRLREIRTLKELTKLIREDVYIRKDSFIAPAIIKKIFDHVYFYCFQNDEEPGLDQELLNCYGAKQTVVNDLSEISRLNSFAFDLDLDLFNRNDDMFYEGELWEKKEILNFIHKAEDFVRKAEIITIAISPGFSGNKKHSQYLQYLVVPEIERLRK
ncbi:MAG TPA: hypothetical protein DCE80_06800 [Ignavibacteriales bacterium]|nr:hypothetical protein [Ignavibacteriales bacterium]